MTSSASPLASIASARGLTLLGCGKMGGAMLKGWLAGGLPGEAVEIVETSPSAEIRALASEAGARLVAAPERKGPRVAVIAVKPQALDDALPGLAKILARDTLVFSVAAGAPLAYFERTLGHGGAVIRSMPNTPAAVGRGATAMIGNAAASDGDRALATALAEAVGVAVWLAREADMDAVTGLSGSGPAYVFHMVEALAAAGEAEGLSPDLAMALARATVAGAGALLDASDEPAEALRRNVTSPNGTTQAGLERLMRADGGLTRLMIETVAAAAARSRELGR